MRSGQRSTIGADPIDACLRARPGADRRSDETLDELAAEPVDEARREEHVFGYLERQPPLAKRRVPEARELLLSRGPRGAHLGGGGEGFGPAHHELLTGARLATQLGHFADAREEVHVECTLLGCALERREDALLDGGVCALEHAPSGDEVAHALVRPEP